MAELVQIEQHRAYGGVQGVYRHQSRSTNTPMTLAVFVPPQGLDGGERLPVLTYLSGLTCTHANVMDKGEYRRFAAELGMILVCPDTSPRGEGVPDDPAYDFGQGAGFYVDAVQEPWAAHFRMYSYIVDELPALIAEHFPVDMARHGIFGHSMGGHGALTLALREPKRFRSVSAFAPISNPAKVPWGRKAFTGYLGEDESRWRAHDTVALIGDGFRADEILVDIGTADPFFEQELQPDALKAACAKAGVPLTLRLHDGYDHSYNFVSTFMESHLRWHHQRLA